MKDADKISLRTAMDAPIWRMVAAGEPERPIDVRMTYGDLAVLLDCYDNVVKSVEGKEAIRQ